MHDTGRDTHCITHSVQCLDAGGVPIIFDNEMKSGCVQQALEHVVPADLRSPRPANQSSILGQLWAGGGSKEGTIHCHRPPRPSLIPRRLHGSTSLQLVCMHMSSTCVACTVREERNRERAATFYLKVSGADDPLDLFPINSDCNSLFVTIITHPTPP
jgi:hypothetical protein